MRTNNKKQKYIVITKTTKLLQKHSRTQMINDYLPQSDKLLTL